MPHRLTLVLFVAALGGIVLLHQPAPALDKRLHSFHPPMQPNFAALSRDEKKVLILGPSSDYTDSRQRYSIFVHDLPTEVKKLGLGSN